MWRRRRTVLNEALHELRRPLQALALAGSEDVSSAPSGIESSLRLAATALERLDREINGGPATRISEPVAVTDLLAAAGNRWRGQAAIGGCTLVVHGEEEPIASVTGDRWAIAQALDNLIVNAIEHGGPRIVISALEQRGRLRISVRDCGRPLSLPHARGGRRVSLRERLRGRSRRGHGLHVVRRVAGQHGGRFALTRTPGGAEAVLELPLR